MGQQGGAVGEQLICSARPDARVGLCSQRGRAARVCSVLGVPHAMLCPKPTGGEHMGRREGVGSGLWVTCPGKPLEALGAGFSSEHEELPRAGSSRATAAGQVSCWDLRIKGLFLMP